MEFFMQDPFNDNSQRRLTLTFVFSFAILAISLFFMPKPKKNTLPPAPSTNQVATSTEQTPEPKKNPSLALVRELSSKVKFNSRAKSTNLVLSLGKQVRLNIQTRGGSVSSLQINGKWNRKKSAVELAMPSLKFHTGDFLPGSHDFLANSTNRPVYQVREISDNKVILSTDFRIGQQSLRVFKTFQVLSNYRFTQKVSVMNLGKEPMMLDMGGGAFSLAVQYDLMAGNGANNRNPLVAKYFDGEKIHKTLGGGFLKKGKSSQTVDKFNWIAMQNNYFMAVVEPHEGHFSGTFLRIGQNREEPKIAFFMEQKGLTLAPGESKEFELAYYVGPRKEKLLKNANPVYSKLFAWPGIFNPLMKPIEWGKTN